MAAPTATDVQKFLGPNQVVDSDQATAILSVVSSMCSAYTRGCGFTDGIPNAEVAAVILSATARLVTHAGQIQQYLVQGPETASFGAAPFAWSVGELLVLNRYRLRAR